MSKARNYSFSSTNVTFEQEEELIKLYRSGMRSVDIMKELNIGKVTLTRVSRRLADLKRLSLRKAALTHRINIKDLMHKMNDKLDMIIDMLEEDEMKKPSNGE